MTVSDVFLCSPFELEGRNIDPLAGTVEFKGRKRPIRRKQLEVLAILASADGAVVTRSTFIEQVWDNNALVGDTGLTDTISDLRQSLSDDDRDHPLIRTIPRRGYQLSALAKRTATRPAFSADCPLPGKTGWQLRRLLSQSDLSQTWLAEGPDSALRVFRLCVDEQHLRMLRREATLLRYLQQALRGRADIAHIDDWQLDEPPYYLQLAYFPLGALSAYAQNVGGLSQIGVGERLRWVYTIAGALDAVHQAGIVHRNLGAHSIFMANVDGQLQPKLGEFGLGELADRTRLTAHQITAAGLTLPGTADMPSPYWAPERLRGEAATAASDVFALGVLLHQIAAGDVCSTPTATSTIEAPLRSLMAACLDPEPAQRPTAAIVVERLAQAIGAPPPATPPSAAADSPRMPNARDTDPIVQQPSAQTEVRAGQTIGPYRIVEKLGQGGMGVVYLADQREPVQRQVALKVILAGMDTMDVLARFEGERQALALMNHVNVAAVYEAGSSATGRPYFAMEYVPGLEITAHCDQRELDFRQRIELFLQVCDGVLHAHQKGIIHRDLKPSNILIKSAQGQPATAKIIDFGVAKSLQRKLGRLTAHTQIGSFVGTPSYSSPEQISGHSAQIDTRTDIYSLGVVLYELLAGVTPYSAEVLAGQSPVELTKLMRSQVPPPLLKRFVSLEASAEAEIAGRRRMTVAQMKATLGSDLSWIVAKCLEHDPAERYASVLEFEKDLRRWLENRPVEARPIRWTYRVRKLIRRNRASVAVGALVAIALLATTSAAVIGFVRAERSLEAARQSANEASLAADFLSKQIDNFNPTKMGTELRSSLISAVDQTLPDADRGVVRGWLDRTSFSDIAIAQLDSFYFQPALTAIENDYADAPLLQAQLWDRIGNSMSVVGKFEQAVDIVGMALNKRIQYLGDKDALTLETYRRRGYMLARLGRQSEAEAHLKSAFEGMRDSLGAKDPNTLMSLNALAHALLQAGKSAETIQLLNPIAAMEGTSDDALVFRSMFFLSYAHYLEDRFDVAADFGKRSLEGQRRVLAAGDSDIIDTLGVLAMILNEQGEVELAASYNREVYAATLAAHGSRHPDTIIAKSNLTYSLSRSDQLDEAVELQRDLLIESKEIQGVEHLNTLIIQMNLGVWLGRAGQTEEAAQVLRTALAAFRRKGGDTDAFTLRVGHHLGRVLGLAGKWDDAERQLRESLAGREQTLGKDHADTLDTVHELAVVLHGRGALADAERTAERAMAGRRAALGDAHEKTQESTSLLDRIRQTEHRD